jgi:hypothetical protein
MTVPANVRHNIGAPFPALVRGLAFITVAKANGIWTIQPNYPALQQSQQIVDPTTSEVVIYNTITQQYTTISLASLNAAAQGTYRTVIAAGDVPIAASDVTILLNKTVGAATNINLPTSASRLGLSVTVKDYKGDANTHNITFVPAAGETIDGFSAAAAAANGTALIDINYGKKTLFPLTSGGWYV